MESYTKFGKCPLKVDAVLFYYMVEELFLRLAVPDSGMSENSPTQLRDHFRAALYKTSTATGYEDFPANPNAMSKEDKLRIDLQKEKDPARKQQKLAEFVKYRKWKRAEIAKRSNS